MVTKYFIVKQQDGRLSYDTLHLLKNPSSLSVVNHDLRMRILQLLSKTPMYPAQIAKELNIHEQKIYYHIKQLLNADMIGVSERYEIRGTVAKMLLAKDRCFAVSIGEDYKPISQLLKEKDDRIRQFLSHFMTGDELNARIVVGSPDPHGPHKARARDGHYAIELAIYLGGLCSLSKAFVTHLDVDIDLTKEESNLIVIGGPITNLVMAKINDFLPAKFSDTEPWGITTKRTTYSDESIGMIAQIPNPYKPNYRILAIAGIRYNGTKAAILALSRHSRMVLNNYTGQKEFYSILQGFDIDGDGRIDSVEVLE